MARRGSVTEIGKEIHFQEDGNFVAAAEKPKTDEEIAADLKASHDARDAKLLKAGYPSKYGTEEVRWDFYNVDSSSLGGEVSNSLTSNMHR